MKPDLSPFINCLDEQTEIHQGIINLIAQESSKQLSFEDVMFESDNYWIMIILNLQM